MAMREGFTFFRLSFFCLTLLKKFVGESFCVSIKSENEKFHA